MIIYFNDTNTITKKIYSIFLMTSITIYNNKKLFKSIIEIMKK